MSSHDYLKGLGPETMMRIDPAQRELIQYVSTTFLRGRALPRESAGQEEIRAFFEELYAAADSFRSGANRVVAWSSDARGFICSMDDMPWEVADADLLSQRMTEQQQMFFYGSLSQAAFVINQPIEGTEQRRRQGSNVLRAHVILIVRTKGGDYYPIAFRWWYDAKLRRWWLTGANRQVSPRMATSPHLAF
jgi:hypothetical protein